MITLILRDYHNKDIEIDRKIFDSRERAMDYILVLSEDEIGMTYHFDLEEAK